MPLVYKETVAAKINGGMFVIELPLQIGGCRSDLYRFVFIFIYVVLNNALNPPSFVPQEEFMCLV